MRSELTGWLDYFITGLEIQMLEVRVRSEQVIRRDALVNQHGLNERQAKAIDPEPFDASALQRRLPELDRFTRGVTDATTTVLVKTRLMHADRDQLEACEISQRGLHWDELDEDVSIAGLLAGRGDMTHANKAAA